MLYISSSEDKVPFPEAMLGLVENAWEEEAKSLQVNVKQLSSRPQCSPAEPSVTAREDNWLLLWNGELYST